MLSPANLTRYLSGRASATSEAIAVTGRIFAPQLGLYLAFWGSFHLLEFLVTARWNPSRLMKDSFLLLNGWNYHAAHLLGILEFILESLLFPSHKSPLTFLNYLGLCTVLLGQYLRSTAMIHASSNFSHIVASNKRPDHMLVKTGLYSLVRHPSYTGFFVWAVGTQLLLANPISTVVFIGVLWRFFQQRIQNEEKHLISFFGEEYKEYKRQVPSGIPFV
ncbi:ICMT-domain-containing protein [Microstroma glucosiphilum]|uniref:Protein-S-isoprenylcysteine O-methyltransferase n=1 Tax=Pseudomicrostroma glucosiphilum TaxID=1684307 RepID=A0A316U8A5_9BASI|nr:ICMT-domain-containing protein [Pseudomicrostroma glucosiphilum]PWN21392.1 ICMT-domain-containing protein [Pseudomicrostroma glucosiphilum]